MDWSDTPQQNDFRTEVRRFFDERLPARYKEQRDSIEPHFVRGTYGDTQKQPGPSWDGDRLSEDPAIKAAANEWAKALAERGWVASSWPKDLGGAGFTSIEQFIFNQEREAAGAPRVGGSGAMFLGNLLMVYGSEEQKAKWMPPIARGEVNWMQGYSEPGSGSDLASLQLRAVHDGDDYVLNGQKIWGNPTRCEAAYVLVRTDPQAPKHKGISFIMVEDLQAPGITGRSMRSMCDYDGNGETFFADARVPIRNRIGEENQGWYVAMTLMDFDRGSLSDTGQFMREMHNVLAFVETPEGETMSRLDQLPTLRADVADRVTECEVGRNLALRVVSMQAAGLIPNYEASMGKVFSTETEQRVARTATKLLGLYGGLWCESPRVPLGGYFSDAYCRTTAHTVYGGSSEIQRNVIATRGLGLPRG